MPWVSDDKRTAILCTPIYLILDTSTNVRSFPTACWITCGKVTAIRVFENEGGVTQYIGGCRIAIIPAGYVGSAIWGSMFVMFSGGQKTATGAAAVGPNAVSFTMLRSKSHNGQNQSLLCCPNFHIHLFGMDGILSNTELRSSFLWRVCWSPCYF